LMFDVVATSAYGAFLDQPILIKRMW